MFVKVCGVLLLLFRLQCCVRGQIGVPEQINRGFVNVGVPGQDGSNVVSISEHETSGEIPVFLTLTQPGNATQDVTVICSLQTGQPGDSEVQFDNITITAGGTDTGTATFSVVSAGRQVVVECVGRSAAPGTETNTTEFLPQTSAGLTGLLQVRKGPVAGFCSSLVLVPNRAGVTQGTVQVQLSEAVVDNQVTVTCTSVDATAGSIQLTFDPLTLEVNSTSGDVTYSFTNPSGSPVYASCTAQSGGGGNQYRTATSTGDESTFALDEGSVQFVPDTTRTTAQSVGAFLVLDAPVQADTVTFTCALQEVEDSDEAQILAANPTCVPVSNLVPTAAAGTTPPQTTTAGQITPNPASASPASTLTPAPISAQTQDSHHGFSSDFAPLPQYDSHHGFSSNFAPLPQYDSHHGFISNFAPLPQYDSHHGFSSDFAPLPQYDSHHGFSSDFAPLPQYDSHHGFSSNFAPLPQYDSHHGFSSDFAPLPQYDSHHGFSSDFAPLPQYDSHHGFSSDFAPLPQYDSHHGFSSDFAPLPQYNSHHGFSSNFAPLPQYDSHHGFSSDFAPLPQYDSHHGFSSDFAPLPQYDSHHGFSSNFAPLPQYDSHHGFSSNFAPIPQYDSHHGFSSNFAPLPQYDSHHGFISNFAPLSQFDSHHGFSSNFAPLPQYNSYHGFSFNFAPSPNTTVTMASAPTLPPSPNTTVTMASAPTLPPSPNTTVTMASASTLPPSPNTTVTTASSPTLPPSPNSTVTMASAPTLPPSPNTTVTMASASTLPPSPNTTVTMASAPTLPSSFNTTVTMATPSTVPDSPLTNLSIAGNWQLGTVELVFGTNDIFKPLDVWLLSQTYSSPVQELLLVTCCAPQSSNTDPKYQGRSAAFVFSSNVATNITANLTNAEGKDAVE
ncbi:MUC4 [Branchiostoma lanceolatum]|uniref:MUC4 protein n=1 Tax=Branchiostoma lanceolatum TaxID=7740 RepID=A0A8K0AD02_BRALA|nr:MUC4 [Branchiostoma lanceolatum]